MGIADRRLRQKEELRASILATAWQLVQHEGWKSLSIRRIAEAIEYSVPVIYDHFENKEAILEEFAREGFRILTIKMRQAKAKSVDPGDQLRNIALSYWNFAGRHKEHFRLMFGVGMMGCEIDKCVPAFDEIKNMVMDSITAVIAKNKNSKSDPQLKYYTFWSILFGLISIKNMRNLPGIEEVNRMVLDDALEGFIKNL